MKNFCNLMSCVPPSKFTAMVIKKFEKQCGWDIITSCLPTEANLINIISKFSFVCLFSFFYEKKRRRKTLPQTHQRFQQHFINQFSLHWNSFSSVDVCFLWKENIISVLLSLRSNYLSKRLKKHEKNLFLIKKFPLYTHLEQAAAVEFLN